MSFSGEGRERSGHSKSGYLRDLRERSRCFGKRKEKAGQRDDIAKEMTVHQLNECVEVSHVFTYFSFALRSDFGLFGRWTKPEQGAGRVTCWLVKLNN